MLFEQSGTALSLYDESGIIDCNPAAVALLGYSTRTELLHRRPETFSAPKQRDGRTAGNDELDLRLHVDRKSTRLNSSHQI